MATTLVAAYVARRVGKGTVSDQLRYGAFPWGLAIAGLAFALLPLAITVFAGHYRDVWAKIGLTLVFGVAAYYCFAEACCVRGRFDRQGITLATP